VVFVDLVGFCWDFVGFCGMFLGIRIVGLSDSAEFILNFEWDFMVLVVRI